ncbi:hypothetical protein ABH944_002976 [Caballeronia udeis]|uniref:Uncharacterized protein n=1 Tax=Caballeronia udeis TaxID=1232866 RepID=A0ABW8MGR6_9BURK
MNEYLVTFADGFQMTVDGIGPDGAQEQAIDNLESMGMSFDAIVSIKRVKSIWTVGSTVSLDGRDLVVKAAVTDSLDLDPDAFVLEEKGVARFFRFLPHRGTVKGLEPLSMAEARRLIAAAKRTEVKTSQQTVRPLAAWPLFARTA